MMKPCRGGCFHLGVAEIKACLAKGKVPLLPLFSPLLSIIII